MQMEESTLNNIIKIEENKEISETNEEDEYKDTRESLDRDSSSQIDSSSNRESSDRETKLNADANTNVITKSINTDNSLKSEEDVSNYEDLEEYESIIQSQNSENDKGAKSNLSTLESASKEQPGNDDDDDDDENNYEDYEDDDDEPIQDKNENIETVKMCSKIGSLSCDNAIDPALVAKKGQFYEHDCRIDESEKNKTLNLDKSNKLDNHEKSKVDINHSPVRWDHDKFLISDNKLNEDSSKQKLNKQKNRYPKNNKYFKNNPNNKIKLQSISINDSNSVASTSENNVFSHRDKHNKMFQNTNEHNESKKETKNAKGLSLSEYMQQNEKNAINKRNDDKLLNELKTNKSKNNDDEKFKPIDLKSRLDFSTRVPTILDSSILDANGDLIYNKASHFQSQSFSKKNVSSALDNNHNSSKKYDLKITTDFNSSRQVSVKNNNHRNSNNSYNQRNKANDRIENYMFNSKHDVYNDYKQHLPEKEDYRNNNFKDYMNDNFSINQHDYKHESKDLRAKSYRNFNKNFNPNQISSLDNYNEKKTFQQNYEENKLNENVYSNHKQNNANRPGRPITRQNK